MNEETYTEFVIAQLDAVYKSASLVLAAGHPTLIALADALTKIKNPQTPAAADNTGLRGVADYALVDADEEAEREIVIPEGFTEETYNAFLAEQAQAFDGRDADSLAEEITDVVGELPDGTQIGNAAESFATANRLAEEALATYEEDEEEVEVGNVFTVRYTRLNGESLTEQDVNTIVSNRASDTLRALGAVQLYRVDNTDVANSKDAVFAVLEEGDLKLSTLALGIAAYRGVTVIPGLGRIQAVGSVDFL